MILKTQVHSISEGRETTFVRFEFKIIFIFSVQNYSVHRKQEVPFAKIGLKDKPDYAADGVLGRLSYSKKRKLRIPLSIFFLTRVSVTVSIVTETTTSHYLKAVTLKCFAPIFFF